MWARAAWFVLACGTLAGCDGGDPATRDPDAAAAVAWEGVIGCADCDAIEMRLQLQQPSGALAGDGRFWLRERYVAGDRQVAFDARGRWQRNDGLLQLEANDGAVRHFLMPGDGRLIPSNRAGEASGNGALLPASLPSH